MKLLVVTSVAVTKAAALNANVSFNTKLNASQSYSFQGFDTNQMIAPGSLGGSQYGWPFQVVGATPWSFDLHGVLWFPDSQCPQLTWADTFHPNTMTSIDLSLFNNDYEWDENTQKPPVVGSSNGACFKLVPHSDPVEAASGKGHFEYWSSNGDKPDYPYVLNFDYLTVPIDTDQDEIHEIVDFNVANAVVNSHVLQVADQFLNNESPTEQSMPFQFSKTVSTTKSFTWSATEGIKVKTEFVTKIPFVAEGKIEVEVSASFTEGGSHSTTDSQTLTANFPINVPAYSCYTAFATVTSSKVDVDVGHRMKRSWAVMSPGDSNDNYLGHQTWYTTVKSHYSGANCWDLGYEVKATCDQMV